MYSKRHMNLPVRRSKNTYKVKFTTSNNTEIKNIDIQTKIQVSSKCLTSSDSSVILKLCHSNYSQNKLLMYVSLQKLMMMMKKTLLQIKVYKTKYKYDNK